MPVGRAWTRRRRAVRAGHVSSRGRLLDLALSPSRQGSKSGRAPASELRAAPRPVACRSARSRSWPDGQVSNVAPLLLGLFSSRTLEVSAARVWSNDVADRAREGSAATITGKPTPRSMQACAGTLPGQCVGQSGGDVGTLEHSLNASIMIEESDESPGGSLHPFWLGCVAGAVPWVAMGIYMAGPGVDVHPPAFVYAIFGSLFVAINCSAGNQWLGYRQVGRWRECLVGERVYVTLSLMAEEPHGVADLRLHTGVRCGPLNPAHDEARLRSPSGAVRSLVPGDRAGELGRKTSDGLGHGWRSGLARPPVGEDADQLFRRRPAFQWWHGVGVRDALLLGRDPTFPRERRRRVVPRTAHSAQDRTGTRR